MRLSILTNFVFVLAAFLTAIVLGKSVFVPIAFAVLIAFLLYPVSKFLEKKLPRLLSISIVFTVAIAFIVGGFALFSLMLRNVLSEIKLVDFKFENFVNSFTATISNFFGIEDEALLQMLEDNAMGALEGPLSFLYTQLLNSTTLLFSFFITLVLAFLFVLYRTAFKNFFLFQLHPNNREDAISVMKQVQTVAQKYIVGLAKAMFILGLLNSLGLWIIGVKIPLFWGFFAASLAIIPFIGTFIGGFFPFIFALATTGTIWQPVALVLMFALIQFLDDNFITPKIVGKNVDVNPLVAIFSLILGGLIWGIPGFILALPYVAVLKILFENFYETQSLAALMSSEVYDKPNIFEEEFSNKKHSITNLFKFKNSTDKAS